MVRAGRIEGAVVEVVLGVIDGGKGRKGPIDMVD